jgi:large subunit ribosomal protein L4
MIELPVYNQAGDKVSSMNIDEASLGGPEVNVSLLKQALVMYHANKRQGTVRTLARGEVEGSTRKIYRQKGTGNARMGSIRQPVRVGGGHAKQKRPKDWRHDMPKKAKKLARNHALLSKIKSQDIRVVDGIAISAPKTKIMVAMFKKLGLDRSVLLALDGKHDAGEKSIERSARNIERTRLTTVTQLNAWDLLTTQKLVITRSGLEKLLSEKKAG